MIVLRGSGGAVLDNETGSLVAVTKINKKGVGLLRVKF